MNNEVLKQHANCKHAHLKTASALSLQTINPYVSSTPPAL